MSTLDEMQADFRAALLDPQRSVPPGVVSYTSLRPGRRFDVYRNNVVMGLIEALKASYPVVARLVGEEFFHAVAREFIANYPPRSPILSRYGSELPEFLRGFAPVADIPYLGDVAEIEWLQVRAYNAADRIPLSADMFCNLDQERVASLLLELHPSIGVVTSPYPVFSIWRTNTYDEVVERMDASSGSESVLVLRPRLDTFVIHASAGDLILLDALRKGRTFGEAATAALVDDPQFDLQSHVAMLIECGAFVDAHLARASALCHRALNHR